MYEERAWTAFLERVGYKLFVESEQLHARPGKENNVMFGIYVHILPVKFVQSPIGKGRRISRLQHQVYTDTIVFAFDVHMSCHRYTHT